MRGRIFSMNPVFDFVQSYAQIKPFELSFLLMIFLSWLSQM